MGLFTRKRKAIVLVDYEYFSVSMKNRIGVSPDLTKLFGDIAKGHDVIEASAYADFSNPVFAQEIDAVRMCADTISTANSNGKIRKNDTDFALLDSLYRKAPGWPKKTDLVLVTGDGHFTRAVRFLREKTGADVILYAVNGTCSLRLKDAVTKTIEFPDGETYEPDAETAIIESIRYTRARLPEFRFFEGKTIAHVSRNSRFTHALLSDAMTSLIKKGCVKRTGNGDEIEVLWDEALKERLISKTSLG
jgi:hypothetical protein